MKHSLKIEPMGVALSVEHGTSLFEALKSCGVAFPCGGKGICGNCRVRLLAGRVARSEEHESMCRKKGLPADWCLACFSHVDEDLVIEVPDGLMAIQTDTSAADVCSDEEGCGVAVDLGSTTVVVQLVDLKSGKVLAERSGLNPQGIYGADVISRIAYAMEGDENLCRLRDLIRGYLKEQIEELAGGCPEADIRKVRIVGNTVMHHLFAGYDVSCLGRAPFHSSRNGRCRFTPAGLGWKLPEECTIEFFPNISHFVGSDILAGIVACGMHESEECSLLVDLGTNGEMAIGSREGIWCTSTAAGPAFEGINISCGMRASAGAVCTVGCRSGRIVVSTIGGTEPRGICGSGLVEAVHCFLKQGWIDSSGMFLSDDADAVTLAPGVTLTAADIREFQLAKAAIATGIRILLERSSLTPDAIAHVYLTGGLGNYVDRDKVVQLGLLPGIRSERCVKLPNAALAGCKRMLYDACGRKAEEILERVTYCPLESDPRFMDLYCDNLFFPGSDADVNTNTNV